MNNFIINENSENLRIDQFLTQNTEYSRSKINKMIKEGLILVNNKKVKASYITRLNDEISIVGELKVTESLKGENIPLDIVYEDNDVIIVNKPSSMVVHPANGNYSGTLVNALINHTKYLSNNDDRPGIVHRIDKDTSGLLMVAKNDKAHTCLSEQLSKHEITRKYLALVWGIINHDTGTIDAPIGRDKKDRQKMAVTDENSKEAITHFKVLERYKNATLIELKLDTGRTHQIRVHLNYIGHPLVNDPVYGHRKIINDFGQMLHAKTIGFIHPTSKKYMEFSVQPPEEFNQILEQFKTQ